MRWNDKQPIYQQLKEKIMSSIIDGDLKESEVLPSIRQLSSEYQINPLTVSKAFKLLVDDGVVEKRRGLGMFVASGARKKLLGIERKKFLQEEWPLVLKKIERLGITFGELSK